MKGAWPMICPNCRHEINAGAVTCPVCGKQVVIESNKADQILSDAVLNVMPASNEAAAEFLKQTGEAAKDLGEFLSIRQQLKNFAAVQSQPFMQALRTVNEMPTDVKTSKEQLLFTGPVLYGGTSAYMNNAKLELTQERLIFYEHVFTNSGLVNIITANIAQRYSFSIYLKQIIGVENIEVNYRPGLLLKLTQEEQTIVQANDHFKFERSLRWALDPVLTKTDGGETPHAQK